MMSLTQFVDVVSRNALNDSVSSFSAGFVRLIQVTREYAILFKRFSIRERNGINISCHFFAVHSLF